MNTLNELLRAQRERIDKDKEALKAMSTSVLECAPCLAEQIRIIEELHKKEESYFETKKKELINKACNTLSRMLKVFKEVLDNENVRIDVNETVSMFRKALEENNEHEE